MKNRLRVLYIIMVVSATVGFSGAQNIAIPNTTSNFNDFSIRIQQALSSQDLRTKQAPLVVREKIFQNFCTVMDQIDASPQSIPRYANVDTKIYYNPKQSVFIHILCGPYGLISDFGDINQDPKAYFFKDDWVTLRIHGKEMKDPKLQDNKCRPNFGMTDCDVPKEFTEIMHRILSDMFDIKQAQLYGALMQSVDTKERFNEFSKNYFVGLELCPDKKCNYPKTENRLLAYFKKASGLLKKLDIINRNHIDEQLKSGYFDCTYPFKATYNLVVCGFGSEKSTPFEHFIAMVENELFFYRLFMAHYMGWIQAERRLLNETDSGLSRATEKTAEIIAKTQQQIAWTQDAVDMSMRSIREMAVTFPIHIGLLIYYEDLYRLRKELVKIVTPLYTLSEKLRNVQKKD